MSLVCCSILQIISSLYVFIALCRDLMMESLTDVIKLVKSQKQESHTIHLLRALPLLHLLRGDCTPFQQCVVRPSDISWNDHSIDFITTQQVMSSNTSSVLIHKLLLSDHV